MLAATVMIVDGIVESIFGENMNALSGIINRGELDFVLEQAGEARASMSQRGKFDWDPLVQVVTRMRLVLWYAIGMLAAADYVARRVALRGANTLRELDCLFALVHGRVSHVLGR